MVIQPRYSEAQVTIAGTVAPPKTHHEPSEKIIGENSTASLFRAALARFSAFVASVDGSRIALPNSLMATRRSQSQCCRSSNFSHSARMSRTLRPISSLCRTPEVLLPRPNSDFFLRRKVCGTYVVIFENTKELPIIHKCSVGDENCAAELKIC